MAFVLKLTNVGNRMLSGIAVLLIILLMTYGAYSLWDVYRVYTNAFVSNDLLRFKPGDGDNALSFAELRKINPDVKAWITVDDTHIDYPVVQGKNDMEYINKDVKKKFSLSGSIFLSSDNKADFSDAYNLTYGHHMDNGGMYGDVIKFAKKKFFDKHKTGTLYLPDGTYRIEIFAIIECDAYEPMIYHVGKVNANMAAFQSYVASKATHYRQIGLKPQDHIISLTTCSDVATSGRAALIGRLTRMDGETSK